MREQRIQIVPTYVRLHLSCLWHLTVQQVYYIVDTLRLQTSSDSCANCLSKKRHFSAVSGIFEIRKFSSTAHLWHNYWMEWQSEAGISALQMGEQTDDALPPFH